MRAVSTRGGRRWPAAVLLAVTALVSAACAAGRTTSASEDSRATAEPAPDAELSGDGSGQQETVGDVELGRDLLGPPDAMPDVRGQDAVAPAACLDISGASSPPAEYELCCFDRQRGAWAPGGGPKTDEGQLMFTPRRFTLRDGRPWLAVYYWNGLPDHPSDGHACTGGVNSRALPPGILYFEIDPCTDRPHFLGEWVLPAQFAWDNIAFRFYDVVEFWMRPLWGEWSCTYADTLPTLPDVIQVGGMSPLLSVEVGGVHKTYAANDGGFAPLGDPSTPDAVLGAVTENSDIFSHEAPLAREILVDLASGLLTPSQAAPSGLVCGRVGEGYVSISGSSLDLTFESDEVEALVGPEFMEAHGDVPEYPPPAVGDLPQTDVWMGAYLPLEDRTIVWIVRYGEFLWLEFPGQTTGRFVTDRASSLRPPFPGDEPLPKLFLRPCLSSMAAPLVWTCQTDVPGGSLALDVTEYGERGGFIAGTFEAVLPDIDPYLWDVRPDADHWCVSRGPGQPTVRATGEFRVPRL